MISTKEKTKRIMDAVGVVAEDNGLEVNYIVPINIEDDEYKTFTVDKISSGEPDFWKPQWIPLLMYVLFSLEYENDNDLPAEIHDALYTWYYGTEAMMHKNIYAVTAMFTGNMIAVKLYDLFDRYVFNDEEED